MNNPRAYRLLIGSSIFFLIIQLYFACSSGSSSSSEPATEGDTINLKNKYARPLRDIKFESTPERIARGKYLAEGILWCFNCHTQRDTTKPGWPPLWEKKGSGALIWKTDSTHLYAPNITPDKKTGIGNFTDDMLARAIREGYGHDDRALTTMPWFTFRSLTDEDVASVVTYLRTIPPIENKIPRRKLDKNEEEGLRNANFPVMKEAEVPDMSNTIARGKYLISLADCIGCHSAYAKRLPGAFGGGNPHTLTKTDEIYSSNISSDSTGVGAWPVETFIYVMKNGKGKGGTLNNKMPWTSYKNMSDADLEAIYRALMTTYPVKHFVNNSVAPTHCEVCGMEHGMGDQNKIQPIKQFKSNAKPPTDIAGLYVHSMFPDTMKVVLNKNEIVLNSSGREWKLIPINSTEYMAEGMLAPINFVRDSRGKVMKLLYNDLVNSYKKLADSTNGK